MFFVFDVASENKRTLLVFTRGLILFLDSTLTYFFFARIVAVSGWLPRNNLVLHRLQVGENRIWEGNRKFLQQETMFRSFFYQINVADGFF